MKSFLRDISFTILFSIITIIPYDMTTSIGKNEYTEKYQYVKQHKNEIKTLIIGSSISSWGVNPAVLGDSVYIFSNSGRTLFYDVKLMEQLLPEMHSVETLIYPLHYNLHLVDPQAIDTTNRSSYLVFQYYRYMDLKNTERPYQIIYRSAFLSNHFSIKTCMDNEPNLDWGYEKMDTSFYYGRKEDWKSGNPPSQPDPSECTRLLEHLAYICQKRHVRLIVYTPPFPDDYIEEMTDEGRANLKKIVDIVNMQYPIEYKDYTDDMAFRDPSLYLNWNHLNHRGATLFAQRVKEDFRL